jgi:hypothetical protein
MPLDYKPVEETELEDFNNLNEKYVPEGFVEDSRDQIKESATDIYLFLAAYAERFRDDDGFVIIVDPRFEEAFTYHFGLEFSIGEMINIIDEGLFPNLSEMVYLVEEDSRTRIVAYEIDSICVPISQIDNCRKDIEMLYPLDPASND